MNRGRSHSGDTKDPVGDRQGQRGEPGKPDTQGKPNQKSTVCLGGAFDILHLGHRDLLDRAAALGDTVLVGLCTDEFANASRKRTVTVYQERRGRLVEYLERRHPRTKLVIEPITDAYGPAREGDFDTIVVSEATVATTRSLNREREAIGLRPLEVVVVPHRLAQDGRPISATRVDTGEIDGEGHLLRPLRIGVGSTNPVKVEAVRQVALKLFDGVECCSRRVGSGVAEQPRGIEQTVAGAINRARRALTGDLDLDLGVGIEAGLVPSPHEGGWLDVQYCAVVDRADRVTLGHGPGFAYPPAIIEAVDAGQTVGRAMTELTGIKDIGRKGGAIGYLTRGLLERQGLTEQAVLAAFLPRILSHLYHQVEEVPLK